jgi:streptogramin lyase
VQLNTGDIVISADIGPLSGGEDYGLMRVEPVTGDRTIISDATHGSGPQFDFTEAPTGGPPSGVSRMAGGDLLVSATNGLFSVDPTTGDRTQITSRPAADAIQVGNQIYAVDGPELFRVDPVTGNITNLVGLGGSAAALIFTDGKLFAPGPGAFNSYSLSGALVASYLPTNFIFSMAATPDGTVLFGTASATLAGTAVGSFNPNVQDPFDYRRLTTGTGPTLDAITGVGVAPNGTVWAANYRFNVKVNGSVVGIDPTTGNFTTLSDSTHGAGPTFLNPDGLAVVPEPGTFVLTVVGGLAILLLRRKK